MDRRLTMLIFAAAIMLFAASCGTGRADMDVTLSPANGVTDQALDVPITAVFGQDVTEPANWMNSFFVKKDNAGETICTSVTYTSSNKTAVCAHDLLEASSSYTATLTGVIAVNGQISTWTTRAPVAQTVEGETAEGQEPVAVSDGEEAKDEDGAQAEDAKEASAQE